MQAQKRLFGILVLALCATASYAQSTLQFTNTDSQVLSVLSSEGIVGGDQVDELGRSIGSLQQDSALSAVYPDDSAALRATVELDGGQDLYRFIGAQECAGLVDVSWLDRQGGALEVLDARIIAAATHLDGGFQVQAVSTVTHSTSAETLAVRGGADYRIEVSYALGADSAGRAATYSKFFNVNVGCDQVVSLQVQGSDSRATVGASDYGPAPADVYIPTRGSAYDLLDTVIALPGSPSSANGAQLAPSGAFTKMDGGDAGATSICTTDTFDGPDVDPVWTLGFIGDADQGSATIVDNTLYLSGNGTSLFHGTDNAAFLQQTVTGDFRASVVLIDRPINQGGDFRKGGFFVTNGNGGVSPRVMVQLIFDHPTLNTTFLQFDYRDENGNAFEMASSPVDLDLPLSVAVDRRGDLFTVYFSTDNGATWLKPAGGMEQGDVVLDMGPSAQVGLAVASYDADTEFTVQFDDFELCRRQNLPKADPPGAAACRPDLPLDLIYVLDASGSMTAEFQGFPSKLEAAADAIAQTNALLQANFTGSRSALVTFRGSVLSDPAFNLAQGAQVLAPITTDLDAVTAAAAAIDPSTIDVDANTPLPIALDRTTQLLADSTAEDLRQVVVLLTDGAPNIDLEGRGASEYRFSEILPLSIRDGVGDFLPWPEIAWLGNFNGGIGTYDGEVYGNTIFKMQEMREIVPSAQIYPIAIEGEDTFYEDLLAFASFYYGTPLLRANDVTSLADALQSVIRSLDCGAAIGDLVWNDRNGNGDPDRGEPPLADVTVELRDETGTVVATTMTGPDGIYRFDNLVPGTYTVTIDTSTLPSDANSPTYDLDGISTPHTTTVTVAANEENLDVDFGYRGVGTIGDRVWNDENGDGVQDSGEAGIENVTVELRDSTGTVINSAVTDSNGEYLFTDLAGGTYTVTVVETTLPANADVQTFDFDGLSTANSATVTIGDTEAQLDVDFGYRGVASIGDRVWLDTNGDGVQDGDEAGINDVTVRLLDAGGTEIASQVTSGDGLYQFTDLLAGTYTVVVDASTLPADVTEATFDFDGIATLNEATVTVAAGDDQADVDFGYVAPADECEEGTYRDDFHAASFSNQDGSLLWTGDWIEDDPLTAGPNGGQVQVHDGLLTLDDNPDTGAQPSAAREADLSGATRAFLNFRFLTSSSVDHDDAVTVEVSDNGGATWTVLEVLTNIDGAVDEQRTFDITDFASENTQVRFRVSNKYGGSYEVFCLDYVEIVKSCADCISREVRDDFDHRSFSNNDGPDNWAGDWIEDDPLASGPFDGQIQIHDGLLTLDDNPDTGAQPSAAREVDLSGATSALLNFRFLTSSAVDHDDAVTVEVSNDGGATWTVLEVLTNIDGAVDEQRTYDITGFASENTQVRFRVSNKYGGSGEVFCLDYIEISSICEGETFLGQISGTVWNDVNGKGVIEDASNGLGGVKVKLRQDGNTLAYVWTDNNGGYTFGDLEAGTYQVKIVASTLPASMTEATFDIDGVSSLNKATFDLGGGENRGDVNFGYRASGGSDPCSSCDHYSGHLGYSGDKDWQPNGQYFWSDWGTIEGWLESDANADFDLHLYRWNGSGWSRVAKSINDGSPSEHISYNASAGYYIFKVDSWWGSGDYDFWMDTP